MAIPIIYVSEQLHPNLQQLCVRLLAHKSKVTHYQIIPQSQLSDNLKMVPHEARPPNVIGWDASANRPPPYNDIIAYVSHIHPMGTTEPYPEPITPLTEHLIALLSQSLPHVFLNFRDNHHWLRHIERYEDFIKAYHHLFMSRQLVPLDAVKLEEPELNPLNLSIGPFLTQIKSQLPPNAFEVPIVHQPPEGCKILARYEPTISIKQLLNIPNFLNYTLHALGTFLQRPSTDIHSAFPVLIHVLTLYQAHMPTLQFPTEHERLNTLHKLSELPDHLLRDKMI